MKYLLITIASLFLTNITMAESGSGSASLSCSGNVKLCTSCASKYFYIYSYQYAYVYNGEVQSESHSFSMSGFLGHGGDYRIVRATNKHVIYTSDENTLAVPYKSSSDGIWVMGDSGPSGPGEPPSTWVKLCPR